MSDNGRNKSVASNANIGTALGSPLAIGLKVDAAIAIQLSGHLHVARRMGLFREETKSIRERHIRSTNDLVCFYEPALRHVRACRARFKRCDVFVHTWSNGTSTTPAGSGSHKSPVRRNLTAHACLKNLTRDMQPYDVWVETQHDPPPKDSLAPDGQRINESSIKWIHQHPDMFYGFRMNLHGMSRAADLRRRSGREYSYVFRMRPDGKDPTFDFGWKAHTSQKLGESLWDCVAFAAARAMQEPTTPPIWAGANTPRWHDLVTEKLNSCGPIGNLGTAGQNGERRDNCFWATPPIMDHMLSIFENNFTQVFVAATKSYVARHSDHMETIWPVAAAAAHVSFFNPCYALFMDNATNMSWVDSAEVLPYLVRGLAPSALIRNT